MLEIIHGRSYSDGKARSLSLSRPRNFNLFNQANVLSLPGRLTRFDTFTNRRENRSDAKVRMFFAQFI